MNTRSPSVIGLDAPGPGNSDFYTMFSDDDHFVGSIDSLLIPSPFGPRN
jgi:hypothetical protein